MDQKEDPLWFAQQLVDTLQREVAQKEAELKMLVSHRTVLLQAFSAPTFPPGYVASGPVHVEIPHIADRSNTRLAERDLSLRSAPLKRKRSSAVVMKQDTPPPPHRTPPSRDIRSESESSDDSDYKPTKEEDRQLLIRAGESSDSSEGELQSSPFSKKSRNQVKFPVVNWTQQIKKRAATIVKDESSSDTGDSASSDVSAHNSTAKRVKESTGKSITSTAPPAKAVTQAQTLSSDAPPEDWFDWEVLGMSGPWSLRPSSSLLAESSWVHLQKQQSQLPSKFQTMDEYRSSFEGLIFEECKAHLNASWDMYETPALGSSQNFALTAGDPEEKAQESFWNFRPMYPSADDPFKYIEAELVESSSIRLDTNEVVLLTHNNRKFLAVVTLVNYKGALLRSRTELPAAGGQCALLRMANMVTLKREYASLCRATEIWDPLQQQLLNPLESSNFEISPPSENCPDEDVKVNNCSKTVSAWKKDRLFNRKQLCAVEALLRLQQGFLLVQGPPGTGKTSTIVGMVSAVHIQEPRARILVCASSNAALDEIVSRLMCQMLDMSGKSYTPERGTLIRLGVEKSIQTACLPVSLDKVLQSNAGTSTMTNVRRETVAGASIVCCTISGSGHQVFDEVNQKFDVLIIDEAAQAQESEVLIALQRVKGRCVMVGDPCQLPAVVFQRPGKAYGRSLFERMQEAGKPVFLMTTQYRMHPLISQFPSATFYGGRLKDAPQLQSTLPIFKERAQQIGIDICGYRFKIGAYCFLDVTWGVERGELVGRSISNVEEAEVVATVVQGVVKSLKGGVVPNIGVITPYLAQRSLIMHNLAKNGVDENTCEVNTVDGFQGREKDVIILSCVRAQADHGLGFVSDVRRMNVALTRARHSLIVVGHAETLKSQSPTWNALVEDASARNLYQILCHKPRAVQTDPGTTDAGGRRALVSSSAPPQARERSDQGAAPPKTETAQLRTHARLDPRTPGPSGIVRQPNHTRTGQGISSVSASGQDSSQTRCAHRASAATELAPQLSSHTRFEEEFGDPKAGTRQTWNPVRSKRPLSIICGLAMGDEAAGADSRQGHPSDTGRGDQAEERSNAHEKWELKVKIEKEDGSSRAGGRPATPVIRPVVPPALHTRPVGRMRGQVSSDFKGSGWHNALFPGANNAVKMDVTDQEDIPFERYPPHFRGSEPFEEAKPSYGRDNRTGMEFGEESNLILPRHQRGRGRGRGEGRDRGRGREQGRGRMPTRPTPVLLALPVKRGDGLERELNEPRGRREDWMAGMHGNSPAKGGRRPFGGRSRGRGRFHRSGSR